MNTEIMLKLYKTYLLPILEYSNLCLTLTKTQSIRIEQLQRKITRYLCYKNNIYDLNYQERLMYLNIRMLESRRSIQQMKFFYKVKVCQPPISQHLINQVNFVIEKNNCISLVRKNRILLCNKYLITFCSKLFNDLPSIIRNETKFKVFMFLISNHFKL